MFERQLRTIGASFNCVDSAAFAEQGLGAIENARLTIICGHDDYWTASQRRALHSYVNSGGRVLIAGGNTCWWKVDWLEGTLYGKKRDGETSERVDSAPAHAGPEVAGPRVSLKALLLKLFGFHGEDRRVNTTPPERDVGRDLGAWRSVDRNNPEENTFGASFEFGGYPMGAHWCQLERVYSRRFSNQEIDRGFALYVADSDHPVFTDTGLSNGDAFGQESGLVNIEVDAIPWEMDNPPDFESDASLAAEFSARMAIRPLATARVFRPRRPIGAHRITTCAEASLGQGRIINLGSIGWLNALNTNTVANRIFVNAVAYLLGRDLPVGQSDEFQPRENDLFTPKLLEPVVETAATGGAVSFSHLAPLNSQRTILVNGISRSGTTLLTTILDGHPQVSMAYEVLPGPVAGPLGEKAEKILTLAGEMLPTAHDINADGADYISFFKAAREIDAGMAMLMRNARRGGLDSSAMFEIFDYCASIGISSLMSTESRHFLAALVMETKRKASDCDISGLKYGLLERSDVWHFPDPLFVIVVRDPRDVLASRKALKWPIGEVQLVCNQWNRMLASFDNNVSPGEHDVVIVNYEALVEDPDKCVASILDALEVEGTYGVAGFEQRAAAAEIDGVNISPVDMWRGEISQARIGRYRTILQADEVDEIEKRCNRYMRQLGYLD